MDDSNGGNIRLKNPHAKGVAITVTLMALLMAALTLFAFPSNVQAADGNPYAQVNAVTASSCAEIGTLSGTGTKVVNASTCLPSGRWNKVAGSTMMRTEPAGGGLTGWASQMGGIMKQVNLLMPRVALQFSQICWSSALGLAQFAASFDALTVMGAKVDSMCKSIVDALWSGNIIAAIIVVGFIALMFTAIFKSQTAARAVGKRILVSIACLAAISTMGACAARTQEGSTTPAKGSPWWVMKTIDDTVNRITVNLDFGSITDNNKNMMTYANTNNCQRYLYEMRQDYSAAASTKESSIVKVVDSMWQETALRSWVTIQWGNPNEGVVANKNVAKNAQQAYCHVLDMQVDENVYVQANLTNRQLGFGDAGGINDNTAEWLFTEDGWIDPLDSQVKKYGAADALERDDTTLQTRAATFWETCGANNGTVTARPGWAILTYNLSDKTGNEIKSYNTVIRVDSGGDEFKDDSLHDDAGAVKAVREDDSSNITNDTEYGNHADSYTLKVCQAVLDNKYYQNEDTAQQNAALIGWYFDVPNTGATWSEANLSKRIANPTSPTNAAYQTIGYLYGNNDVDTGGAYGSLIGSICNLLVWGAFSCLLILSKMMMVVMAMFLIVALACQMVPVGETCAKAMKGWTKTTLNLCLVGFLYVILGTMAQWICGVILDWASVIPGSFFYNLLIGLSPVLACVCLAMFFSFVLHRSNPFSLKAIVGLAGGGAMVAGLEKGVKSVARTAATMAAPGAARAMFRRGRGRGGFGKAAGGFAGKAAGKANGTGKANASEETANKAAMEQDAEHGPRQGFVGLLDSKLGATNGDIGKQAGALMKKANEIGEDRRTSKEDRMDQYRLDFLKNHAQHDGESMEHFEKRMNRYANARNAVYAAGQSARAGLTRAGAAVSLAGSAVWNNRSRIKNAASAVAHATPTVAGAAVAGLAMSNPITAPAGILMAGSLAAKNAKHVKNGVIDVKDALQTGAVGNAARTAKQWTTDQLEAAKHGLEAEKNMQTKSGAENEAFTDAEALEAKENQWKQEDEAIAAKRAEQDAQGAARSVFTRAAQSEQVRGFEDRRRENARNRERARMAEDALSKAENAPAQSGQVYREAYETLSGRSLSRQSMPNPFEKAATETGDAQTGKPTATPGMQPTPAAQPATAAQPAEAPQPATGQQSKPEPQPATAPQPAQAKQPATATQPAQPKQPSTARHASRAQQATPAPQPVANPTPRTEPVTPVRTQSVPEPPATPEPPASKPATGPTTPPAAKQ